MSVIQSQDEFMRFLSQAYDDGALIDFCKNGRRGFSIETPDGGKFVILAGNGMYSLISHGFGMWFDNARIEKDHPVFCVAIVLYRNGMAVARIGKMQNRIPSIMEC